MEERAEQSTTVPGTPLLLRISVCVKEVGHGNDENGTNELTLTPIVE